jgi:hypothetical protein
MNNVIQPTSMPPQQVPPLPPGATSIYNAGLIKGQEQTNSQMTLIGKSGGRRMNYRRGGAPLVQVPSPPAGTLNPELTSSNYKDLTQLSQLQSQQAVYDNAKTPAQTANISTTQNALYKGGYRRHTKLRKTKIRKTKKHKNRQQKTKKHKNYKRKNYK